MKKLMLSTALVAATAIPSFADNHTAMFHTEADPMLIEGSDFIGMRVYRAEGAEDDAYEGLQDGWDDIGEIHDIILNRDGSVHAVLVDIGGFLGIGENQVAVKMDAIRFVSDSSTEDDETDYFLVLNAPREALDEAPAYESAEHMDAEKADAEASEEMTEEAEAETEQAAEEVEQTAEAAAEETAEAADAAAEETAEAADAAAEETAEAAAATEAAAEEATDGDATAETTETMDREPTVREGYNPMIEEDLTTEALTGARAYDANDEDIGEVSELIMTDAGKLKSAIIDVGGFLGLGEKPVELEIDKIDILRSEDGSDVRVYIPMTKEELEAMPDYEG